MRQGDAAATNTLSMPLHAVPRVVRAGRFPLAAQQFTTRYFHPTLAIHVHGYAARLQVAGQREVEIVPGDVTLTPADTVSRYHLEQPGQHWCMHLLLPRRGLGKSPGQPPSQPLARHLRLGAGGEAVAGRIAQAAEALRRPGALSQAHADALALELLCTLALASQAPTGGRVGRGAGAARAAAAWIDQHLASELSVPRLAAQVHISQQRLAISFRAMFGVGLLRYQLQRRVAYAQQLLRNSNQPVGQIARLVGIADAQYFNKQFRRITGQSPSHERRGQGP